MKVKEKKHGHQKEKPLFACQPYATTVLAIGNIKELVVLQPYIDEDEWLAANGTSEIFQCVYTLDW